MVATAAVGMRSQCAFYVTKTKRLDHGDGFKQKEQRFLNTNESEYFLFLLHFIQRANKILHNSPQVTMHLQNAQDNLLLLLDLFTYAIRKIKK